MGGWGGWVGEEKRPYLDELDVPEAGDGLGHRVTDRQGHAGHARGFFFKGHEAAVGQARGAFPRNATGGFLAVLFWVGKWVGELGGWMNE